MKRTTLLTALALLSLFCLQGCEEDTIEPVLFGNVFGEVLERTDNVPVAQATISTNPPTSSVSTDAGGRFVLDNIPEGTYSLRAERDGFLTQVASVTVFGDQDANVIVRLERDTIDNAPPSAPTVVSPVDGATGQPVDVVLQWTATDADEDDVLEYEVLLFDGDMQHAESLISGTTDTAFVARGLDYGTNYFWQVVVSDGRNASVLSEVWGFTTLPFPDQRILFARAEDGRYDIYSADGLGAEIRLTDNGSSNWRPRMNPQRTRIAFISNRDIQPQLYVMNRDGSDVQQVTTVPISGAKLTELDFCWSPDGTRLLYMANSSLYLINVDGTGFARFAQAPVNFTFAEVDWTDQGDFISYRIVGPDYYRSFIGVIDEQGNLGQYLFLDRDGATTGPRISIPGDEILYSHDVSGFESIDERSLDARIFRQSIATGAAIDVSFEKTPGTNDLDPIYSPDGSQILFTNTNNDGVSRRDIYIMNLDGTERELLFAGAEMVEWK